MSSFYVLDLDRTLVDTSRLYNVLESVLKHDTDIDIAQMYEERSKLEARGETFTVARYVRSMLEDSHSDMSWQQVQDAFIKEALQSDMLEPHAAELLQILDEKKLPYGIVTYGNEAWQLAKIEASGLMKIPHLVTRIKEKGELLAGWKHEDGTSFIIPPAMTHDFRPLTVDTLIFLDDKAVSFEDIPSGVEGIFVKSPTAELLPSQRGDLPPSVVTVLGLGGAIELLFKQ